MSGASPASPSTAAKYSSSRETRTSASGSSAAILERAPGPLQPGRIGGERRAGLVSVGREVMEQDFAPVGGAPAEEVALLASLSPEPTPEHTTADTELGGEHGPDRGMAEGIGRVEHVEPPPEALRIRAPHEQVAHQRFTGGDQLVGEHVPGTDLEPAAGDQPAHSFLHLGPHG
jgi:hypothetical protein